MISRILTIIYEFWSLVEVVISTSSTVRGCEAPAKRVARPPRAPAARAAGGFEFGDLLARSKILWSL